MECLLRDVDAQGRLVIPKKWREEHLKSSSVLLIMTDDEIIIKSNEPEDIIDLIDSVPIDLKSELSDWDKVRKELYEIGEHKK